MGMNIGAKPVEGNRKLVGIVDDDFSMVQLLHEIVQREGFKAFTALDGKDALEKIQSMRPDVVILDLMLPHYGGYEVLRALQGTDQANIPIIVITARDPDESTIQMIRQESNVVLFLKKPIEPQHIKNALHKLLEGQTPA